MLVIDNKVFIIFKQGMIARETVKLSASLLYRLIKICSMNHTLVIIACGAKKIWDNNPDAGSTSAKDACTGAPFRVNRRYAETFGDRWVILSAKYGFIDPDFIIPENYNVTFKKPKDKPSKHRRSQKANYGNRPVQLR